MTLLNIEEAWFILNVINYLFYCFLQLGPWLAVEIPELISRGVVVYKEKDEDK